MYRKALAKVTATMMVIAMVGAASVTSFAEDTNSTVYQWNNQNNQVVEGNVTVSKDTESAVQSSGGSVEVTGSVEGKIMATNGGDVIVDKDVTSNGNSSLIRAQSFDGLIWADGSGTEVTVDGNVDGSKVITNESPVSSTYTYSNMKDENGFPYILDVDVSQTTSGGATSGVCVQNGASVTVGKDVSGGKYGAIVTEKSSLNVGGNVNGFGEEESTTYIHYDSRKGNASFEAEQRIDSYTGKPYTVYNPTPGSEGETKHTSPYIEGTGIRTDGDGSIFVGKNVTGVNYGITIQDYVTDGNSGSIVVLGTIKADDVGINIAEAGSMASYLKDQTGTQDEKNKKAAAALAAEIPDITIYAIDAPKAITDGNLSTYYDSSIGATITRTVEAKEAYQIAYNSILEAISYIIKQDDASNQEYGITVTADNANIEGQNYLTAKINHAFSVAANLPAGYTIDGGDYVSVVNKGNGIYSLTLTDPHGGINIKAKLIPVVEPSKDETYEVVVEKVEPKATGTVVVTTPSQVTASTEMATLVAAISGEKPAQTLSFEVGSVPVAQYKEVVIENIKTAPANGALNIVADKPSLFDAKMFEAISARSDVDVNVVFNYGGKRYKVVIPAGYNVMSLLDSQGYCGYLRLLALLGGDVI